MKLPARVKVVDVGPRDGLQNESAALSVEDRVEFCRALIDAGLPVAISTDYNPGSCPQQSLAQVMTWAALRYRMSAAECLTAATLNPACSLGRGAEIGSLEPGKRADLVIFSCSNLRQLVSEFGASPVRAVIVRGSVVRGADRMRAPLH